MATVSYGCQYLRSVRAVLGYDYLRERMDLALRTSRSKVRDLADKLRDGLAAEEEVAKKHRRHRPVAQESMLCILVDNRMKVQAMVSLKCTAVVGKDSEMAVLSLAISVDMQSHHGM